MSEPSNNRTRAQQRHDFNAALHTARVTLRALRPKIEGKDDLELLDGAAEAVNRMAEIYQALQAPQDTGG